MVNIPVLSFPDFAVSTAEEFFGRLLENQDINSVTLTLTLK